MTSITRLFTGFLQDKSFYSRMLKIASPIMIQNFISSLLNMVDTLMIGKLGETEIAAVGIANQYFFFFNMLLIGICSGCSVFISQYWGKKDVKNIRRILGIGLVSVIFVALLFILVGFLNLENVISLFNKDTTVIDLGAKYLRAVLISYLFTGITFIYSISLRSIGKAIQPMIISVVALLCNVFFNYILIFGKFGAPTLGVEGAAIATVIARVVETILILFIVYKGKGTLSASLKELLDVDLCFFKRAYKTIFPVILNDSCWGLASLVYIAVYGRMGTGAVAAIQICNTVNNLFMVITFGLSSAAAIIIGNSIGAGEESKSKDYAKKFIALSVALGILMGLILALLSPVILNLFNVSYSVKNSAQTILYMISLIFTIRVLDIVLIVGILRGGGDAGQAFLIEGLTMWLIGVPLTIIGAFILKLPVHLVYALALVEELFKCIFSLMRLKSGKWINNLT